VITLWDDSELRNRLVASALELVESHYSWSAAATRIAASLGGPVKKGSVLPV
jgi:glycosyltransferase involved in cell wall biosynthesis